MFNGGFYNGSMFNGSDFRFDDAPNFSQDQKFILHCKSASGVFIRKIEGFTGGTWSEKVNAHGSLKITLPLDGTTAQSGDMVYPNRIWIHDGAMRAYRQMVIVNTSIDATKSEMEVECYGLLYLLSQEFAAIRDETSFSGNMRTKIVDALAYQKNASPITLRYIAPKYANDTISIGIKPDMSIFSLLMEMWKQKGGALVIDNVGGLQWFDDDTTLPYGALMSLNDDIDKYKEHTDSTKIINRLYAYGEITNDAGTRSRQELASPGYIEDAASQSSYGIRVARKTIKAENQDEFDAKASRILAYYKEPKIKRDISAIDLAKVQLDADNPVAPPEEYIYIGAKLRIQPPSNVPGGTVFGAMITSVERDMSNPQRVKIRISADGLAPDGKGYNDGSSFFDELSDIISPENVPIQEIIYEADEDLWDAIDGIPDAPGEETSGSEIQPVGTATAVGTNTTKFAPSDHVHEGIPPIVYDASYTTQSDLGNPQEVSIGFIKDGETDSGWWVYPPDGTTNGDWLPMNHYA